jgi:hypothetical protein
MPPAIQRRNTAYLKCRISRSGRKNRALDDQGPRILQDLRLISGARSNDASDPLSWPLDKFGTATRERRGIEGVFIRCSIRALLAEAHSQHLQHGKNCAV